MRRLVIHGEKVVVSKGQNTGKTEVIVAIARVFDVDPNVLLRAYRRPPRRTGAFNKFMNRALYKMRMGLGLHYDCELRARGGQPPKRRRTKRGSKRLL